MTRNPVPKEAAPARVIGYARVSTDEQTWAQQVDALRAAGAEPIFVEQASGAAGTRRPKLERAIALCTSGDVLVVWKLDRIGRSLRHLLDVADDLRSRGVALRSLTEAIDTGTSYGEMLYAVLGAVAQFERAVLRERTSAALAAKRRRGERIGRRPALTPMQLGAALQMVDGGTDVRSVAHLFGVGRSTLYRALLRAGSVEDRRRLDEM